MNALGLEFRLAMSNQNKTQAIFEIFNFSKSHIFKSIKKPMKLIIIICFYLSQNIMISTLISVLLLLIVKQ